MDWWPGREATDEAICAMGAKAVPFLLKRIENHRDRRSRFKERIVSWLRRLNLTKQANRYYDTYGQERLFVAMQAFHALKPRGSEVVPALIAIANDPQDHRRFMAIDATGWVGSDLAVAFLLQESASTNARMRTTAFLALQYIHPDAGLVLPTLTKALGDGEPAARVIAADTLRDYGPDALPALPALMRLAEEERRAPTRSPNSQEHRWASEAAERALDEIAKRNVIFDSRWRSPQNPFGQRPPEVPVGQPLTNCLR
jgi:HEAT repeat protein